MPELAPSTFLTGPNDKLAAVDIYKLVGKEIKTLESLDLGDFLKGEFVKYFNIDVNAFKDLKIAIDQELGKLLMNVEDLKKFIMNAANGALGIFNMLPEPIRNLLLNTKAYSKFKLTYDNISRYIEGKDFSTIEGLANLIGGVFGCEFPFSVDNGGAKIDLASNLLIQCSKNDIDNVYSTFINCLAKQITDNYIGIGITERAVDWTIESSDYKLLDEIADNKYADYVTDYNPNFVLEYLQNFTLPPNMSAMEKTNMLKSIVESFNMIDPTWVKNQDVLNGSIISKASPDFRELLLIGLNNSVVDISKDTTYLTDIDKLYSLAGLAAEAEFNDHVLFMEPVVHLNNDFPELAVVL